MNWSVKVKLFKALATANPPPPPFPSKGRLDYYWPWLNNIDQGVMKGGVVRYQTRVLGALWVRNCKILCTFCPRLLTYCPWGHKSVVSEVYAVLISLYTAASEKGHCCTATNFLQFILWCVTFISWSWFFWKLFCHSLCRHIKLYKMVSYYFNVSCGHIPSSYEDHLF